MKAKAVDLLEEEVSRWLPPTRSISRSSRPRARRSRVTVDEVTAPSVQGEFGVLPGHLPVVAALRTGIVTYRHGAESKRVAVGSGFAEAGQNKLLILAEEYVGARADRPGPRRRKRARRGPGASSRRSLAPARVDARARDREEAAHRARELARRAARAARRSRRRRRCARSRSGARPRRAIVEEEDAKAASGDAP